MHTINQFFNLSQAPAGWISGVANSAQYGAVKQQMTVQMGGFPVPPTFDEMVIRQLAGLLDVHMGTILVGAWRKHREIVQYRDTQRYPPGEAHVVPLLEHTVTSRHSPTIQPIINNVPLPKITFDVVLRLKLKGAMLKIQAAKIDEILLGECLGQGSIEYEGLALVERETAPVALPGSIVLKNPVAI